MHSTTHGTPIFVFSTLGGLLLGVAVFVIGGSALIGAGATTLVILAGAVLYHLTKPATAEMAETPRRVKPWYYPVLSMIGMGALTLVWSGVWMKYLRDYQPDGGRDWYFAYGFFFTGLVLLILGVGGIFLARIAKMPEPAVVMAPPAGAPKVEVHMPPNPSAVPSVVTNADGQSVPVVQTPVQPGVENTPFVAKP